MTFYKLKSCLLSFVVLAMLFTSCNFSKGSYKDLGTGLSYTYNGFTLDKIVLLDGYNEPLSNNKLPEASSLLLLVKDFKNYTVENGKVYLGCRILVTDSEGKEALSIEDLYEKVDGIPVEDIDNQAFQVRLANPIVSGGTYHVTYHLYDKKNEKNQLNASVNIKVTPNEVDVKQTSEGLTVDKIFLAAEGKGELPKAKVKGGTNAAFVFDGLKGFTEENGKVFPGCKLTVTDKNGEIMLMNEDLFENISEEGITLEESRRITAIVNYGSPMESGNTYHVNILIFDKKNSTLRLETNADVEVIK